ncbi:MAG: hypothetical protein ACLR9R_03415 [Faecalibacterium prausnitzii]
MNLSKKTIKHILRILDNKCIKSLVETAVFSDGEIEFVPKYRTKYGIQYVVYAVSDGYFYSVKFDDSDSEEFVMAALITKIS